MKVLIVNPNMCPGGAERQLYNLGCYLLGRSIHVEYLLFAKEGRYLKDLEEKGAIINVFPSINKGRIGSVLARMRYVRDFTKQRSISTVISFLPTCNIFCELAKILYRPKWKLITGARRCESLTHEKTSYKFHYWCYSASDAIISNAYLTKDDILKVNKCIKPDKIKVIYNYLKIDTSLYNPNYAPSPDGIRRVAVAANYGPTKNIMSVIDAISEMDVKYRCKIHVDWYGVIQTDAQDNLYERSKELIAERNLQDNFGIHDTTPEINRIMSEADAVGLFSYSEGFPNCVCEGLFLGKTIICTPVSDIPRMFKDTKNIVCEDFTVGSIRKALEDLVDLPDNVIIENLSENHKLAESLFSEDNIKKIVELIR